jgi:peptidoglycan/LPS O-acetylase OafA/YrhL
VTATLEPGAGRGNGRLLPGPDDGPAPDVPTGQLSHKELAGLTPAEQRTREIAIRPHPGDVALHGRPAGTELAAPEQPTTPQVPAGATGPGAPTKLPSHDLPVLEAYRGVAALMVLVTHVGFTSAAGVQGPWAGWLSRLDFGVTLFFLLSGFLLFRPFVQAAYATRPPVAVRSYLRRRYIRIYPAFLLTVVGVYALSPRARAQPESLWIQTIFMVQNYLTAFAQQLDGMVQMWSLVVEVSFYLTLPVLAWLCLGRGTTMARAHGLVPDADQPLTRRAAKARRRSTRRRIGSVFSLPENVRPHRPAIVLALFFAGSLAWRFGYHITSEGYGRELLWLPAFLDWFTAGMFLAWLRERPTPVPEALRNLAQAPGVCLCLGLAGYWLTTTKGLGGPFDLTGATAAQGMLKHITFSVVATLLLLPAIFGEPGAGWRKWALSPVMRWLGQISFGVFLWHPILMETIRRILGLTVFGGGFWVTLVLTLIVSLIAGTLSWRYVEEPAQRRFRNGFRSGPVGAREPTAFSRLPIARVPLPLLRRRPQPADAQ